MRLARLCIVLCAALLMVGLSSPALAAQPAGAQEGPLPPVNVDPAVFDGGFVGVEEIINAEYEISNPTSRTLYIDGFTTSCKCTAPVIHERVIEPGQSVRVTAAVDLRGVPGEIRKSFTLLFRGYDRHLTLEVQAFMTSKVRVDPLNIRADRARIHLTAIDGEPFKPIAIHNEGAQWRFTALRPSGAEEATRWQVDFAVPSGTADTVLMLETNHPEAPLVTPRFYTGAASRPEIEFIKQRSEIYSVRTHALLDELNAGESKEIECQLRRPSHAEPLEVYTNLEGLEAEVVSHTMIPGEEMTEHGLTKMYTIRITNTGTAEEAFMTPLYFQTPKANPETGRNFRTRIWLMGICRDSDPAQSTGAGDADEGE